MALIRWKKQDVWDPFGGLDDVHQEMNQLFGSLLGQPGLLGFARVGWLPAIEVSEDKDQVVVRAELPGVKKGELTISVHGDQLLLKGERKRDSHSEQDGLVRSEIAYGTFQRVVDLPAAVDPQQVKATYKDGLVEIRLPKVAQASGTSISVDWN